MPRLLYPANKLALMIRLAEIDLQTGGLSLLLKAQLYIRQRLFAVNLRLPLADEIQIWAIEDEDRLHWVSVISWPPGAGACPA